MNQGEPRLNPPQFSRRRGHPRTQEEYLDGLREARERIAMLSLGEEVYTAWLRDRLGLPEGAPLPPSPEPNWLPPGHHWEPCVFPPGYHWYRVRFNVEREKGEQKGFRSHLAAPNPMMAARRARKNFLRHWGPPHPPPVSDELGRIRRIRVTSAVVDDAHWPQNGVRDPHGQAPD